jgi:HD-GYP domain-containing protein (c-di-GMP phosphodiesterase class II)
LEKYITQELYIEQIEAVTNWLHILSLRDSSTEEHARRVTDITINLAHLIGLPESEMFSIWCGSMLHDIGKLAIPESILLKSAPLTTEEWEVMRLHPWVGAEMIKHNAYLSHVAEIPLHHHEKWDGTGYPNGLSGEQIPLSARIFAFADVYDALTSERPYRSAWKSADALAYIYQQAGIHFDPMIVPIFLKTFSG